MCCDTREQPVNGSRGAVHKGTREPEKIKGSTTLSPSLWCGGFAASPAQTEKTSDYWGWNATGMNGLSNNVLGFFSVLRKTIEDLNTAIRDRPKLNFIGFPILSVWAYCHALLCFINVICAYFNSLVCFIYTQAMRLGQRCISFVEGTRCSNPCLPMTRHCVSRILLCPIYL